MQISRVLFAGSLMLCKSIKFILHILENNAREVNLYTQKLIAKQRLCHLEVISS